MPTLQDILESDLGISPEQSQQEKVASQDVAESDSIEKLAMEIGLTDELSEDTVSESQKQTGHKKEAHMSLENLYGQMFPGDADVVGGSQEKTASLTKEAAEKEEAMGEVAFDHFQRCVDGHITKIAEELAGGTTVDMHSKPGAPAQSMASNEVDGGEAIDTDPEVQDAAMGEAPKGAVGDFDKKSAPKGEQQMKQAALRKHMLLSQISE